LVLISITLDDALREAMEQASLETPRRPIFPVLGELGIVAKPAMGVIMVHGGFMCAASASVARPES
jgi:hypothetical protein